MSPSPTGDTPPGGEGEPDPGVESPLVPQLWTPWTMVGWLLTALGFGVYIPFASEEADRQNAGELVSSGVRTGVVVGGVMFLAGVVVLLAEGIRRGAREDRLAARLAGQLGLAFLAVLVGSVPMSVVVHLAFG